MKIDGFDGKTVKILKADYLKRKADAYFAGTLGKGFKFEYPFEREAWLKGELDNARLHEEIDEGKR